MSPTPNAPLIPVEIQDIIIDQLHTDTTLLSKCSLVSKQWLKRARHWLYARRQVRLIARSDMPDSFYEKRDARRFIELLDAPHSTLAPYVQRVLINGPDVGHEFLEVIGPQSDYDVLNALISKRLPLLCSVHTITIAALTWDCLLPEAKAVIASLQQVTTIIWDSMVFRSLTNLLEFCSTSFLSLHSLEIGWIKVAEPETQDVCALSTTSIIFPQLRLLDVVALNALHPLLSVSPSVYVQPQNIETLRLRHVSIDDAALINCFIEAAGSALCHVGLDIASSALKAKYAIGAFPISFNRNPNLRSLDISTFALHPSLPCNTSWLQDIVATITSQKFEEMTLWFCTSDKEWVEAFDFEAFERSLIHRVDPPALPTVRMRFVHTHSWADADHPLLVTTVERRLSVLHKRGVLVVYPKDVPVSGGWWPFSY